MPVNYTDAVKLARMTATRDHFANGSLEIQAADNTVLAIFGLSASGGTVATDTWTLVFDNATVAGETAAGSGGTVATQARVRTATPGQANDLTGLTVGTTGTDIVLDNTNIASGQNVTLTSATIQHAT